MLRLGPGVECGHLAKRPSCCVSYSSTALCTELSLHVLFTILSTLADHVHVAGLAPGASHQPAAVVLKAIAIVPQHQLPVDAHRVHHHLAVAPGAAIHLAAQRHTDGLVLSFGAVGPGWLAWATERQQCKSHHGDHAPALLLPQGRLEQSPGRGGLLNGAIWRPWSLEGDEHGATAAAFKLPIRQGDEPVACQDLTKLPLPRCPSTKRVFWSP